MPDFAVRGPVREGNLLSYALGPIEFGIDLAVGARIVRLAWQGQNMLLEPGVVAGTDNANNFGSTFWPSPQAAWGWPPIVALDSGPFSCDVNANREATLESGVGVLPDGSRLVLTKRFLPVPERGAMDVTYRMKNVGEQPLRLAPWQITRVAAGGITFFAAGPGGVGRDDLAIQQRDGVVWYVYDPAVVVREGQKTFADGKGWLAHVHEHLLLVQTFPDLHPGKSAPGESEIELYANPGRSYVELEPQGELGSIEPGQTGKPWTVRWYLRPVPASVRPEPFDLGLVDWVRELLTR